MPEVIPTTLTLITGPEMEPLDLSQVKRHLRFTSTSEDTLLDGWIAAARQYFEEMTSRQIMAATWELWLDGFPFGPTFGPNNRIELPRPALLAVQGISYVGSDGTLVTLDPTTYTVMAPSGPQASPGWVQLTYGSAWPVTQFVSGAVRVRFQAGYGSAPGDVPELVRQVLYLLIGHFHKYRSETVETRYGSALSSLPLGVETIMRGFRYTALPKYPPRNSVYNTMPGAGWRIG